MKAQEPAQAVPLYQQLLRKQPRSEAMWRGLFMAEAQAGQAKAAHCDGAEVSGERWRGSVKKDPIYLRTLAMAYEDLGDGAEAERLLVEAINLHYPPGQEKVRTDTLLQYAQTLGQNRHYRAGGGGVSGDAEPRSGERERVAGTGVAAAPDGARSGSDHDGGADAAARRTTKR